MISNEIHSLIDVKPSSLFLESSKQNEILLFQSIHLDAPIPNKSFFV